MAERQPLLGSKSHIVQETGHHRPLYPPLTDEGPTHAKNQQLEGGPPYQQGDFQTQQLVGRVPGQSSSSSSIQSQYKLETFAESRVIRTVLEPYEGRPITKVATTTKTDPWAVTVRATNLFQNSEQEVEIPNTVSVKSCHECHGTGFHECNECNGRGGDKCTMCNGGNSNRGRHREIHRERHREIHRERHRETHSERQREINHGHNRVNRNDRDCFFCKGSGRSPVCSRCDGNGSTKCSTCKGTSQLKTSIKMTVTRTNNTDIIAGEATGIPQNMFKHAKGRLVFEEELPRVNPIRHFEDQSINNASSRLIAKHNFAPNKKIIKQRQSVNLVPISQVRCIYKGASFHYFVYGFDNKVYAPDYPAQCCCAIL